MKDNMIFYYQWSKESAKLRYILTQGSQPQGEVESLEENLEKYVLATFRNQKTARANLASVKAKQAEEDKIANSLKGKNVTSLKIKIIEVPNTFGHQSQIRYGIEALTSDGKSYKTKNLGGKTDWDSFKVTAVGGEVGEEKVAVPKDCKDIPNDQMIITASSKYHPHIKDSKAVNIKYNNTVSLDYKPLNFTVKATKTTHKKTGQALIKVEIASGGRIVNRLKVTPTTQVILNAYGRGGTMGSSSSLPTRGQNGGNVTFIKDPSVGSFSIIVNNRGGRGGRGSNGGRSATNGADGRFITRTQAVSLSW